jgi:hypothetical protein
MMYKKPECDYENYDGVKYEEDKAVYSKSLSEGPKWRGNWSPGVCMKALEKDGKVCGNSGIKCDVCFRYDQYVETESK